MSISQGNGPLTTGLASALVPQDEQTETEKLDHLYEQADPGHESAEGDDEADISDSEDAFNDDAIKE